MATESSQPDDSERPDFMVTLGLLPPYTLEDVRTAYRAKVLIAHPDRGGEAAAFHKLQEAYDRALQYVQFRSDRRRWVAAWVEPYLRQEEVTEEVRRLGGQVQVDQIDWMKRSFGDFFTLFDQLRGIRLRGLADGDRFLHYLAEHRPALPYLIHLDLAGSRVSDEGVLRLGKFELLRRLNLAGTAVSRKGLQVLKSLPNLEWLNLAGTSVGWWGRWCLRQSFPGLRVVAAAGGE
jgi:hypothetical protein